MAAKIPGNARGKLIRQKIVNSFAPNVLATRSRLASIWLKAPSAVLYINGKETIVAAIAAPYQVNTIVVSNGSSSLPTGPFLPKNSSSKNPTTVGGRINGATNIPSIKDLALPRYPNIQ